MSLQTEIERYHSPHVRNLIWALLSPALINTRQTNFHFPTAICTRAYQDIQPQLASWDQHDEKLGEYLQCNNHYRLGIYFERCWLYLLQHSKPYRVLAHNLPIRAEGKTLGEFDLLVEDTNNHEIEHWELTIKFYLQVHHGTQTEWLGPNLKDRLNRKYRHLIERQLALSDNPKVQQYCETQGWRISRKRLLSRGRLFYQFRDHPLQLNVAPDYIYNGHLTGMWISAMEFRRYFATLPQCPQCVFFRAQKSDWMSNPKTTPLTFKQISVQLELHVLEYPIQLLVLGWKADPQVLFVVPDHWQAQAQNEVRHLS